MQKEYRIILSNTIANLEPQGIGKVYDYASTEFQKYPAVVVRPAGRDREVFDTNSDRWTLHYHIFIFQAITSNTKEEEAEKKITKVADLISDDIKGRLHLGNSLRTTVVGEDEPGIIERPNQVMMGKVYIDIEILQNRSLPFESDESV